MEKDIKLKGNMRKTNFSKDIVPKVKKEWDLYLLLIPMVVWYIVFAYKPMYGLQIAFKDYNIFKGIAASPWVGLDNFRDFMSSPDFFRTVKNTIMISVYGIVFAFPAPIILALLINEAKNKFLKNIIQTLAFLPHFISIVVVSGMVVSFLAPSDGVINLIISKLGFEKIYFLTKPQYFRGIYTGMNIWKSTGFNAIVYIAALAGIDQQLYEAARVDGAGKWQQMKNVTVPGILPTIVIMFVLNVGNIVKVGFESIILLYQPATFETADVISTYVYRTGLQNQNYGLATAAGLFEAAIALILVYGANRLSKKLTEDSLW
ncbi:ABC transporter permease [Clostridium grantii]|uniref:Carbohydrate ABC transporter membrane protein 1, CUT1 family (TC 3.A.1.1.-) n=1 Tax=Clostridium grantii DSM 8605 TaxID=1121316 RepID=A0A1M5Y0A8_9CLOT|nr:ABC transporter permease subunit [Clostridium grantii]SHI05490.1 carbohydrate ABC transporter membrane protein 1, CUT1 family (TC 3.A.1.1.-) [Clostridium grantii DSM 8605]